MTAALRDHMCQRWLHILNLFHHNAFNLADAVSLDFSQRCL